MTPYSKMAQTAISAMSRLAQVYDPDNPVKLRSAEIARQRGFPQPVVAKVLTTLSQAGLVTGSPGPGGGYWLAKAPDQITLYDVAILFDRPGDHLSCPFGPDWCGNGPQCPLHLQLESLRNQVNNFLQSNTFAQFVGWDQEAPPAQTQPNLVPLTVLPKGGKKGSSRENQ